MNSLKSFIGLFKNSWEYVHMCGRCIGARGALSPQIFFELIRPSRRPPSKFLSQRPPMNLNTRIVPRLPTIMIPHTHTRTVFYVVIR